MAIRLTSLKPCSWDFFEARERKKFSAKAAEWRGALFTGSRVGLWALCLALGAGLFGAEAPPLTAWKVGSFTLHAALKPFRLSWYFDGKLLVAQRGRRSASLEFLDDGGWHALANVIGHRAGTRDGEAKDGVPSPIIFDVASEGGRKVAVEVSWSSREGVREYLPRVSLVFNSAPGTAKILAVRDDLISFPGESLVVVPSSSTFAGGPQPLWSGKELPVSPSSRAASRGGRLLFSSRGFGLLVRVSPSERIEVLAPDPDTIRLQAAGSRLEYWIFPGKPKEILERSARHLEESKESEEGTVLVDDWAALRRVVDLALVRSLLAQKPPILVSIRPKDEGKKEAARELLLRATEAAVLFSNVKLDGPTGLLGPGKRGPGSVVPLFVEFPQDLDAWKIGDEWLLDGRILAAPILEEGKQRREVYLPPGLWKDLRKKEPPSPPVRGPARVSVEVPLGEEAALFEREKL